MELKQAVAVSLIAVVAASLVLLLARALDLQTASRLEPQLAQIAEELQTVRKLLAQGRTVPTDAASRPAEQPTSSTSQAHLSAGSGTSVGRAGGQETLVVWYFHGTMRCPTCQTIESLAHEVVQRDFGQELASGRVVWKTANYEKPIYSALAQKMQVRMPVVALARMADDQLLESKTLEEVWGLVQDKTKFREFLTQEIRQMLQAGTSKPVTSASTPQSSIRAEPSAASEEASLATRPNLLRLNPPDPPGQTSPEAADPEAPVLPSKIRPTPEAKDLPLPQ